MATHDDERLGVASHLATRIKEEQWPPSDDAQASALIIVIKQMLAAA
jgi:hypothetical protein